MHRWPVEISSLLLVGVLASAAQAQQGEFPIGQFGLNADATMFAVTLKDNYDTRIQQDYASTLDGYRRTFQAAGMQFNNQGFGINPAFSRDPYLVQQWQATGGQGTMVPMVGRFWNAQEARSVAAMIANNGLGDPAVIEVPIQAVPVPGNENLVQLRATGGIVGPDGTETQDVFVWDRQRPLSDSGGSTYLGTQWNTAEAPFPVDILGVEPDTGNLVLEQNGQVMRVQLPVLDGEPGDPTTDTATLEPGDPSPDNPAVDPNDPTPDDPAAPPPADPVSPGERGVLPSQTQEVRRTFRVDGDTPTGVPPLTPNGTTLPMPAELQAEIQRLFPDVDTNNLRATAFGDQGRAYMWVEDRPGAGTGQLTAWNLRREALGWTKGDEPLFTRTGVRREVFFPPVTVEEGIEVRRTDG